MERQLRRQQCTVQTSVKKFSVKKLDFRIWSFLQTFQSVGRQPGMRPPTGRSHNGVPIQRSLSIRSYSDLAHRARADRTTRWRWCRLVGQRQDAADDAVDTRGRVQGARKSPPLKDPVDPARRQDGARGELRGGCGPGASPAGPRPRTHDPRNPAVIADNVGDNVGDVAGMGADHLNEVDLFNIRQIEIIRGPSSLLYAKGALGGVVNIIDNTISQKNFEEQAGGLGVEFQTVNEGDSKNFFYENNVGGLNLTFSFKDSQFGNYDIPNGAIIHSEEEHEDEDHDEHEEDMGFLANSDFGSTTSRFGRFENLI